LPRAPTRRKSRAAQIAGSAIRGVAAAPDLAMFRAMLNRVLRCALIASLAAGPAVTAVAADHQSHEPKSELSNVKRLGGGQGWDAYLDDAPRGKICYLVGKPKKIGGGHVKPGDANMSVTHRPAEKVTNVVNFLLGVRVKKDSDAILDIDGHKYHLFTNKSGAWTRDAATDRAVVVAMTHGRNATIKAEPDHGAAVRESYDLNGFTAALDLINKACDVRQ
jgi:Invasion associated locus B (IalB) protein